MIFKVLGNSVALDSATNVSSATLVRIVNTNAGEQTITVANTFSKLNGGGNPGTFVLEAGAIAFLAKTSTDTIVAGSADVKGTPVARA